MKSTGAEKKTTKTKNGTTDMARKTSVAQGAKILSTGIATSGMLALTAVFGAVSREANYAQSTTVVPTQPPNPTQRAQTQTQTQAQTQTPMTTEGQRVTGVTGSLPGQTMATVPPVVQAVPNDVLLPSGSPIATEAVVIVAPQPIVVMVPDTKPIQAPPTTASR